MMASDEEYFYADFMPSYSSNDDEYEDETAKMSAVLEETERAEEHVLNFNASTKGHSVLNRHGRRLDSAKGVAILV